MDVRRTGRTTRDLAAAVLTLLLGVGCTGTIGAPDHAPAPSADPIASPTPPAPPAPAPLGDAFTLSRSTIQLLPFSVRLSKLAAIAQVAVTDPLLAPVVSARLSLGDHDYAHGIPADRSWTASKLTAWVAAVRPICASTQFRARFPALPEDLGALVEAAYGRAADADDRALVDEALAELAEPDPEARYTAVCLAVLSSTELVAQ